MTTIRVLHVDDNEPLRDLTAELLERVDEMITVQSESDPTAVLPVIETGAIDCVVSDYEMPEMNGLELCEQIRCDYPDLPFFLFTNKYDAELVDRSITAGVTDYIEKEPGVSHYKILANRIRNAVDHHQARKRIEEIENSL